MSATFYANLFCGVKIVMNETHTMVTKYNENTGKPYEKPVFETSLFIKDTNIKVEVDEVDEVPHCIHMEDVDGEPSFIGFPISEICDSGCEEITIEQILVKKEEVKKYLKDTYEYTGRVKIFNSASIDY